MIRRFFAVASLAVLAATAASAQVEATFHQSGGTFYYDVKGEFTANGAAVGGGFANLSPFQIWCVDQGHFASSTPYNVYVTKLDAANLDKTRVGATQSVTETRTRYSKAAWLANTMTSGNQDANQFAIWAIVNGRSANTECTGFNNVSGHNCVELGAGNVADKMTLATTGALGINTSEWYIISDHNAWNGQSNVYNGNGNQEFLAKCQLTSTPFACDGTTQEEGPTPEPATMSLLALGLAGMAGSSLRRRKK